MCPTPTKDERCKGKKLIGETANGKQRTCKQRTRKRWKCTIAFSPFPLAHPIHFAKAYKYIWFTPLQSFSDDGGNYSCSPPFSKNPFFKLILYNYMVFLRL
ncbi:hypothetical protein POVWA2_059320 [Plasmodium ovale wallikeri]|uniref:Uncharacterized protein n=1 Tax=Plasmodium ovale wallikeri TaxID=864142 RepID=A0A1A9A0G1_PLAOA|nr:hypothetical protein POVWA1_059990 [Plasmodium ovale wallikeri]SBT50045.1 hypothetical protein POVWA2_059320 [Plasmodium ovale wallikeri]